MKKYYTRNIILRCITCGGEDFEFDEDRSHIKCNLCNREYPGGYDELVELNEGTILEGVDSFKAEISAEIEEDITRKFRKIFSGNKFIRFK
ncbi:MAG: hypothetical protein PUB21_11775 [Bacteroidales bacterium]|nr:hypothetical protein [Bacteroidales bacterium]